MRTRLDEGVVALAAACLLFVLPTDRRAHEFTLSWRQAVTIDWGTIILFGAGIGLGTLFNFAGAKYFEVQKYAMRIDYIQSGLMVLMAADKWARLSPAQQKAMTEAAAATEKWASQMTWDVSAKSIDTLKANGMEIVEPDLAAFRKSADEASTKFDGQLWSKGTLEKIRAVK